MENTARRPLLATATLATAGALALAPVTVASPELHMPSISSARISTQAVQLTDAWSDLATNTVESVVFLASMTLGQQGYDLPSPTIFLAPIATQIVLNQLIYLGQLFNGQAAQIPGEIATHLNSVGKIASDLVTELPPIIVAQLQTPFVAVKQAIDSIGTSPNPLIGLLEAPAVFLDFALNYQTGLLGRYGPIGVPIIIRNGLAKAIDPPLPSWLSKILQPAKPAATTTVTLNVPAPTHTAYSNRSKSKAAAPTSNSAKPSHHATGSGHSKRT